MTNISEETDRHTHTHTNTNTHVRLHTSKRENERRSNLKKKNSFFPFLWRNFFFLQTIIIIKVNVWWFSFSLSNLIIESLILSLSLSYPLSVPKYFSVFGQTWTLKVLSNTSRRTTNDARYLFSIGVTNNRNY